MKLCKQCKKCGKCGKPYTSMSNYAEKCKGFEEINMPDKKLTDSEIPNVKELLEYKAKAHCELCDLKNLDCCNSCIYTAIKQFIELFNRLQAEKQNLEIELQAMRNAANGFKAEVERLKAERDKEHDHCNHYARMCVTAKSEAYKEFAERLMYCYAEFDEENEIITLNNLEKTVKDCLKDLEGSDAER